MRVTTRRNVFLGSAAFLAGVVGTLALYREPTEPLTREALFTARQRWKEDGIRGYEMHYRMHQSTYSVRVRDGIVDEVTVNGQRPTSTDWRVYSVDGLLDTLEQELDRAEETGGSSSLHMRVRFNPKLGYVERFLRGSSGMGKAASIEDVEFRSDAARR